LNDEEGKEVTVRSNITEEIRNTLQSGIIDQYGKELHCKVCKEKYHILDLKEIRLKLNDTPYLRYICPACKTIVVEATL